MTPESVFTFIVTNTVLLLVRDLQVFQMEKKKAKPAFESSRIPVSKRGRGKGHVTKTSAMEAPAAKTPSTKALATKVSATKTKALITKAPATKAPVTKAPVTKTPATKAPATKAPATKAQVTKASLSKTPVAKPYVSNPSMTKKRKCISANMVEFEADPHSLKQILDGESSHVKRDNLPRMSIYDVMDLKKAQTGFAATPKGRSPFKTLNLLDDPSSAPRTCGRMSVYDKMAFHQSAVKSALKTTEKKQKQALLDSKIETVQKALTWSERLAHSHTASPGEDVVKKQILFTGDEEDDANKQVDANHSLMEKIQEAEDYVNRNWMPQTDTSEHLLPLISGVSRLADTPQTPAADKSIRALLSGLKIVPLKHETHNNNHGSPELPSGHKQIAEQMSTHEKPPCTPSPCNSPSHPDITLAKNCNSPFVKVNALEPSQLVDSDVKVSVSVVKPSASLAAASPDLTGALHSINTCLKKTRRRSAALIAKAPADFGTSELREQLKQIYIQQQRLEQDRLLILQKLGIFPSSLHQEEVTGTIPKDSIILAEQLELEQSAIDHENYDNGISFIPSPTTLQGLPSGLRPISTAQFGEVPRGENLRNFQPELGNITEQKSTETISSSGQSEIAVAASHSGSSKAADSNTLLFKEDSVQDINPREETQMDVSDNPEPSVNPIYISESGGPHIPPFTAINHIQGSHLLANSHGRLPSTSPHCLKLQSNHISHIDCIKNGHSSRHYETLLNELKTDNSGDTVAQQPENSVLIQNFNSGETFPSRQAVKIASINESDLGISLSPLSLQHSVATMQLATQLTDGNNRSSYHSPTPSLKVFSPTVIEPATRSDHPRNVVDTSPSARDTSARLETSHYVAMTPSNNGSAISSLTNLSSDGEKNQNVSASDRPGNPVAISLVEGDTRHFVPIDEKKTIKLVSVEGSAFSSVSPGDVAH